jgi:hypothetical protein
MRDPSPAGLSAAEAARATLQDDHAGQVAARGRLAVAASELARALRQAFDAFDEPAAQAILDRLVSDLSVTAVPRGRTSPSSASGQSRRRRRR